MQGLEAWPPCHGSGDPDAAAEVTVAMREDGYIARRAQDAILGCPAGVAFQHAALLVTQLVADHRPAPVRAPAPVQQPRDEAGLIIDASNAAYAAAEAADLAAQAAPSPGAARDAARAARAAQYQAGAAREAAWVPPPVPVAQTKPTIPEPPPAVATPRKKTPKQQAAVAPKRARQKDRKRRLKKGLNPPSPPCSPVDSPSSEPTLAKRMPEIRVMPSLDAALGR